MNKRIAVVCSAVLLVATLCYAQVAREPVFPTETLRTNTSNLGLTGLNTTGNPGFIMMRGVGQGPTGGVETDTTTNYILWIDESGDLCLASHTTISAYSSYPTGDWGATNMEAACTVVGGQS